MEAFVVVNKGTEDVAKKEIKELVNSDADISETIIRFPIKDYFELCTITYKSQSISKAVLLLSEFDIENSLSETLGNFKITKEISKWATSSFRVDCERHGEHNFNSVEISSQIAKLILQKYKIKIDYNTPDNIFFLYIYNKRAYFGVDFSGIDLSKRQYKIFHHPKSLKGTTAYYLVRKSGFTGKEVFVDPFMGSGMVVIEAGLYAQDFPVHYYNKDKLAFTYLDFFKKDGKDFFKKHDGKIKKSETDIYGYDFQLRFLKATQKNSKLAGIEKNINLSKVDIGWIDTKFEKHTIDLIVTDPPRTSKHKDDKKIKKVYDELFYQADFVLKKKGKVVLLTKEKDKLLLERYAKKHSFIIKEQYLLNQGHVEFKIIIFQKGGGNEL